MALRRLRLLLVVVTLVVLETTVFRHLRVFDTIPNLCLVATAAIAYEEGAQTGAIFGFASGLALDMFLNTPVGLSALAFALTGYGIGYFQGGLVRETRGIAPLFGLIAGLVGGVIFVVVGGIVGVDGFFSLTSVKVVIISSVYDAVLAPLIFLLVHWANNDPDRARGWR